jgi:hypothetical protein
MSMDKVAEVTTAIKRAWDITRELAPTIKVDITADAAQVLLSDMRGLEQVPGEAAYRPFGKFPDTIEAYKVYDGIKFFCLMRQAEYEALKESA